MKKLVFGLIALTPAFAFAAPGPYASVQAGVNWVVPGANFFDSTVANTTTSQNDSYGFAGGAAVGYLWGDNTVNYGLEADGLVYPNSQSSSQSVNGSAYGTKYDGYNLSLLAVLKFTSCSSGFTGFVKAGGAYVNQQVSIQGAGGSTITTLPSTDTFSPEVAVGVGYMITPRVEIDLTADEVFASSQKNLDSANITNIFGDAAENRNFLLGLTYHFA